jgi:hypothetical protein
VLSQSRLHIGPLPLTSSAGLDLLEKYMNGWLSVLTGAACAVALLWSSHILALDSGADQAGAPAAVQPAAPIDPEQAEKQMETLSQLGYHPFLMPLIMENQDAIGLTQEQVQVLRDWRSKYRVPLLHTMNRILGERIRFQRIALNRDTSEFVLRAKQEEIFRLHQKVLEYQLSCRRTILDTFTDEQWDNFAFVLTEHGYALD